MSNVIYNKITALGRHQTKCILVQEKYVKKYNMMYIFCVTMSVYKLSECSS